MPEIASLKVNLQRQTYPQLCATIMPTLLAVASFSDENKQDHFYFYYITQGDHCKQGRCICGKVLQTVTPTNFVNGNRAILRSLINPLAQVIMFCMKQIEIFLFLFHHQRKLSQVVAAESQLVIADIFANVNEP